MSDRNPIQAVPYLKTVRLVPENQETPISFLKQWLTDSGYFYRRNHFRYPEINDASYALHIGGLVRQPIMLRYNDLLSMPSVSLMVPLECSGNKRTLFEPKVYGEQWDIGAISQAVWKGVPLSYILNLAGMNPSVREIVFTGADSGPRTDMPGRFTFSRSLPLTKALHPDTIVAYELNGLPIPYRHGYPMRLIVPQWYAMASVKWLTRITATDKPFEGPYQTVDYVYDPAHDAGYGKEPVTTMNVNSIIQQPLPYAVLARGKHDIHGIAWSGEGSIDRVEVSTDNGAGWVQADLYKEPNHRYAWTFWSYEWNASDKGEYTLLSRATDSRGRTQPEQARWNRKGYGYNAVTTIKVKIE